MNILSRTAGADAEVALSVRFTVNASSPFEDAQPACAQVTVLQREAIEALSPELAAIREARERAQSRRLEAESALREAEQVESELRAHEKEALAAAFAERKQHLARIDAAVVLERKAHERVAAIELQLVHSAEDKEAVQQALRAAVFARDEIQRALDGALATLVEYQEQLRIVEEDELGFAQELASARRHADEATRGRELLNAPAPQPVVALPAPLMLVASVEPPAERFVKPLSLLGRSELLMQRITERRAADKLRVAAG